MNDAMTRKTQSKTLRTLAFCGALVTLAMPGVAEAQQAEPARAVVELVGTNTRVRDSGLGALSPDDSLNTVTWAAGYQLPQIPGLQALVLFDTTGLQEPSRFAGGVRLDWRQRRVMAAVDYGRTLWTFLRPSARFGLGYAHQLMRLDTQGDQLRDWSHDLVGLGAVGLEARLDPQALGAPGDTPIFGRMTIGVRSQFGYLFQTASVFDELRPRPERDIDPEDRDPWSRSQVDVGTLELDGICWSIAAVISVGL